MPTIPWRPGAAAQHEIGPEGALVFASRLPLRGRITPPRFMLGIVRVMRQLRGAEGLCGYSLRAEPVRGVYWTLSAWTDAETMNAFVGADPHHAVMRSLARSLGTPTFTQWQTDVVPVSWDDAVARLTAAI